MLRVSHSEVKSDALRATSRCLPRPAWRTNVRRVQDARPPAPHSVYLLAEHLDAALAAGEDLARVRYVWTEAPPRSAEAIAKIRAGQRGAVERIKTFELALIARLLKAREWAALVASMMRFGRHPPLRGGHGHSSRCCGRMRRSERHRLRYRRRSHRLSEEPWPHCRGCAGHRRYAPIAAGDGFLVARRVPLGVLLDLVATFLDALEAEFDLFVELPKRKDAGEPSRPADVPLQ